MRRGVTIGGTRSRPGVRRVALLSWALALSLGCSSSARGPVDRSVDAGHATDRTIGESVESAADSPSAGSVLVDVVTFPVRLLGRVVHALVYPVW